MSERARFQQDLSPEQPSPRPASASPAAQPVGVTPTSCYIAALTPHEIRATFVAQRDEALRKRLPMVV